MTETVNIDAEYMNRWLGNTKIKSLSPKVLHDVQTLIEHYRDIIVPQADIDISFPVEGEVDGPCASVSNGKVLIPFSMLERGEVDQTIGAMIHELHHIKWTPSENDLHNYAFSFLLQLMRRMDVKGISLAKRLLGDGSVTYNAVVGSESATREVAFIREILSDMLLLMNAVEDIRIDANTPPNLKKYIDKSDAQCAPKIVAAFEKGDFNDGTLTGLSYRILGHHKGMFHCPDVAKRYGELSAITDSDPHQLQAQVFKTFSEDIASHVYAKYLRANYTPEMDSAETDFDNYFAQEAGDSSESTLRELEISARNFTHDYSKPAKEAYEEEEAKDAIRKTMAQAGEDGAEHVNNGKWSIKEGEAGTADRFHEAFEQELKGSVMSKHLFTQVQSFRHLQVITTTEADFKGDPYTFDVVFYDSVQ